MSNCQRKASARSCRRGFSIIEISVAVVILSILVSLAAVMLSSPLKSQRQFSLRERQRREFVRLDTMLRSDVHAATSAVVTQPDRCQLKGSGGDSWRYERQDDWLVRIHSRGEKQLLRESFFVRPGTQVTFKLASTGSRQLVEMHVQPTLPAGSTESHQIGYFGQALLGGSTPSASKEQP